MVHAVAEHFGKLQRVKTADRQGDIRFNIRNGDGMRVCCGRLRQIGIYPVFRGLSL